MEFPFKLLTCARAEAEARTPVLSHDGYNFFTMEFVLSGGGYVKYQNSPEIYCGINSVYFLHYGSTHQYYHDKQEPWHKIFCTFEGDLCRRLLEAYGLTEVIALPEAESLLHYFRDFEYFRFEKPEKTALLFHQFANSCADLLQRDAVTAPPEIVRLKKALELDVETSFSLKDYAEKIQLSQTHLIKQFEKYNGKPPYEYLLDLKIQAASNLLKYSVLSIKEISAILNFCDPYHFSNLFKRKTGCSPEAFRQKK